MTLKGVVLGGLAMSVYFWGFIALVMGAATLLGLYCPQQSEGDAR